MLMLSRMGDKYEWKMDPVLSVVVVVIMVVRIKDYISSITIV